MGKQDLLDLLREYRNASEEFQATSYWKAYEKEILKIVSKIDFNYLRSGRYPRLASFGFADGIYSRRYTPWKKAVLKVFRIKEPQVTPYYLTPEDMQEMAFHHCQLVGRLNDAKSLEDISVSTFGSPGGVFTVNNNQYTVSFLNYYLRYCFAHRHIKFTGKEVIVEIGSGSGYQVEILKKLYPEITIICFDLPAQIYLCERYLSEALGNDEVVKTNVTLEWRDLSLLEKGKVYCFGCWQVPLLNELAFDVFWNAASFGEMEPDVVNNYLGYVKNRAKWIYLLQKRHGQKTTGRVHVKQPITLAHYRAMLNGYRLIEEQSAFSSINKMRGDYFEGIWRREYV